MISYGIFKTSTPEEQEFIERMAARINNPMKLFRIEYYQYNKQTDIFELHQSVINAKQLAELVIDNAYNKEFMFREVKEL